MRVIRFIGARSYEERKLVAEGDDMLMELNNWIDDYMFDEQTKKYYHEWDMEIRKELALEKQVEEIAKTMLKEGYDKKEIKKITKIPISRLNTLL